MSILVNAVGENTWSNRGESADRSRSPAERQGFSPPRPHVGHPGYPAGTGLLSTFPPHLLLPVYREELEGDRDEVPV
jgi:hypothetical protein